MGALTDEEKNRSFRKSGVHDLVDKELRKMFWSFTLPGKAEGFDEIKFAWKPEPDCENYLKAWKAEMKLTQRGDDLQPGKWFKDNWGEWQGTLQRWRRAQNEFQKQANVAKAK